MGRGSSRPPERSNDSCENTTMIWREHHFVRCGMLIRLRAVSYVDSRRTIQPPTPVATGHFPPVFQLSVSSGDTIPNSEELSMMSPELPTFRLSATELLPFRERVQDGIGMPGAMAAVARPGILARIGHHRGPHRVGLDVPQNDEQVVAVLDDRGSEAALPDVAAGSLSPVVPPGVSDGQGLEDAADRLPGGPA